MTEYRTIEEIFENASKYDSIRVRGMESLVARELLEAMQERLIALGLKHCKEYGSVPDDTYDYTYETTIDRKEEGKVKIIIDIKYLLPDIKIEYEEISLEDEEEIE